MPGVGPPQRPPRVTVGDEQPLRRLHFRLWQISLTAVIVAVTCWTYTLNIALGLAATFLAKHLLVAILAAGLTVPPVHDID
jgi:hypothetical protein